MIPIPYDPERMLSVEMIAEGGRRFRGEYLDMRIDRRTVPRGKYAYDCRHDDSGDWVTPATIERRVWVNFAGTFVTDEPIDFPNDSSFIEVAGVSLAPRRSPRSFER